MVCKRAQSGQIWADNRDAPGTTYTYQNVVPAPPFTMSIAQGDGGCELNSGSVTVNDLATVGPDHLLSRLDALLKAICQSSVPYWVTVRMRFHEAADLTPPGPVTGLQLTRSGSPCHAQLDESAGQRPGGCHHPLVSVRSCSRRLVHRKHCLSGHRQFGLVHGASHAACLRDRLDLRHHRQRGRQYQRAPSLTGCGARKPRRARSA